MKIKNTNLHRSVPPLLQLQKNPRDSCRERSTSEIHNKVAVPWWTKLQNRAADSAAAGLFAYWKQCDALKFHLCVVLHGVPASSDVDPGTSNTDIAHNGLEKGSGDLEEDVISDFQTDMAQMVGGINMCNHLLESMSTKSNSTSVNIDCEGCSIREVMAELHSILGVSIEDEFHNFVMEYLSLRRKREMWASMSDKEQKLR
ncbi:hypothetical protein POTOM_032299 [Populus tomentosa]|uniref:Uncharacterized protein n=1 Tax=Populus tomentosa TaxID=118781 RepID=A0A8X8CSN8_POPTO|nr:hypothetical protein POTOM_032299 [Populus tomentosa]